MRAPSSRAAVATGPGVVLAPPFVPSQGCGPPLEGVLIACPSVVTGPSKMVCVAPSTRRFTDTGAALAAGAAKARATSATGSAPRLRLIIWPPFPRGLYGLGRGQVSWLGAPRRAFPGCRKHPSGISDASAPVHSGGTAPASHRTSLDHRPIERRDHTPAPKRAQKRPLQSPTDGPPSSRGLGRRPLTAETGVRIPVAVLAFPLYQAGFVLFVPRGVVGRTSVHW
jgi:hypothetical protein